MIHNIVFLAMRLFWTLFLTENKQSIFSCVRNHFLTGKMRELTSVIFKVPFHSESIFL